MINLINLFIAVVCWGVAAVIIVLFRDKVKRDRVNQVCPNNKKSIFISPLYDYREAKSLEAVRVLVEQGYDYVCSVGDIKIFRKKT